MQTRNNFTSKRADKQEIDLVNQLQDAYDRLLKAKKDLYGIDAKRNKTAFDNKKREIDNAKDEISTLKSRAKTSGVNVSSVQNQFLAKAKELREWIVNQSIPTDEELFAEYERLTKQLESRGRTLANSIGNGNVWTQGNAQKGYVNTQNQLDEIKTEFSNRGFLKASSSEWAKTNELLSKRGDIENAVTTEINNRINAEQESIEVGWQDAKNINTLTARLEGYRRTLEGTDEGLGSQEYSFVSNITSQANSLFEALDKNIGSDKNQIARNWANQFNIQGIDSLADAYKYVGNEAEKAQRKIQKFRDSSSQENTETQAIIRISNLQSQLHDYLEKFPKVEKKLSSQVTALRDGLAAPNASRNVKELSQQMAELRARAKSMGLETENLIDKFENLFGQHLSTMITMAALHKMQEALGVIYQNVVDIDTAMTELRKVTNLTSEEYDKFMDRASIQAQKLGVSISDIINSTADWSRLGYSPEDAENLATYSTLLKNVGDGIDDVNTSSSYLISTLQGFGLLASDAEDIVNKIDAVANTQPVTANDLGEILTRSSAAMAAANNTLEETIALGTAANAVIQDADSVGTVLKTLSMYLRASKTDAEAAGIEVDGMADSVSKLRSELLSLTGVDVMADNKNFKSTYQIMKELSEVWGSLSDVTQANVTEKLAGKRNANAVSAILSNFDVAESAMESAANSANVAWEENDEWLDSIQGRLNQLDASFQALSTDVLDSDLVKTVVSLATGLTKAADAMIKFTGAIPMGAGIATFITQLGKPKMTGFTIVPSNTPGGDTEQACCVYYIKCCSAREYLVKPTNMAA
jgi:TP901 family phage tail tape measure protein|nr:MAG TPA: minor tail protein [Caudoviricetes sp.]